MSLIDREKMLKKYRYLTNTTKSAKERMLPERELPCLLCGKPITQQDVDTNNCDVTVNKDKWNFFHNSCARNFCATTVNACIKG